MSLLSIDIVDILAAPVWTTDKMGFSSDIDKDIFESIICLSPMTISLRLIRQEYGIQCVFDSIQCVVSVPSEGISDAEIHLSDISRELHLKRHEDDPDDLGYIHSNDEVYDLSLMIEQEILIAIT